jgi:hypothetical protein
MHATKTYRLKPEAIEQTMRQEKTRRILGILATAAVAMFVLFRGSGWGAGLYAPILVALAGGGIAVVHSLKRKRTLLETYTLTLNHTFVRRTHRDRPPFEIRREEVQSLVEKPGTGLRLRTASRFRYLDIPTGLEGYDEVCAELRSWAPPPLNC